MKPKASRGFFFEDFHKGQLLRHPIPRTVTEGDLALYIALTGDRRPLHCSATFAQALGFARETLHDWLAFHFVFGKTVGQVSLNAVANLGYADGRFLCPVHVGDTLHSESEVLGTRELSSGKAGIVWVRTRGMNQHGQEVIRYCRWVMVEKRDPSKPTGARDAPELPKCVPAAELRAPSELDMRRFADVGWATGGAAAWEDYQVGERIDHVDGMTIDESDHTSATRLYQNTARVHFNLHQMAGSRFGRRLIYGGHVISVASSLAFNGLENALHVLALNSGMHANPTFAGDTIYAWTEITEKAEITGRDDVGAIRTLLCAVKNVDPTAEPVPRRVKNEKGEDVPDPRLVLELDLWLLMPRKKAVG
ncbi:MAG: MaoC family dehydratase [Deltaproteobacteria bacterium]|nr:MaoC family dehydratase [Deltaproteobacteria bacterium]